MYLVQKSVLKRPQKDIAFGRQMSREYYTQEWIFLLLFFSSHIRYRDTCSNITTGIMLYPPKQNKKTDEKTVLRIYYVRDVLFFVCKTKV